MCKEPNKSESESETEKCAKNLKQTSFEIN